MAGSHERAAGRVDIVDGQIILVVMTNDGDKPFRISPRNAQGLATALKDAVWTFVSKSA